MSEKTFLPLLIPCVIWFLGVPGTFANKEIMESSDSLVRQKRVVSYLPGEDKAVKIVNAPYVVRIKQNMRTTCVGSIISLHAVITSAPSVLLNAENYVVVSASAHTTNSEYFHNVTQIKKRTENSPDTLVHYGVAVLTVSPQFMYNAYCQPIRLHIGPVLVGSFGKIHGWGYNFRSDNKGTKIPTVLRSIEVPVILHQDCKNRYRPHLQISEKTVCTFHPRRHSGHIDFGAGLVVDNSLAGVFLWSGSLGYINPQYPDVFTSLQDPYYNQWIRTILESIDLRFH